ncbi:MAG: methylmalonyl Co-A mutase-associated GTPase MeaB [Pseudomonadota bacterium]
MVETDAINLAERVRAGDRRGLSKAITLVESTKPEDHNARNHLVDLILPDTGDAIRIGISGLPGVGKSTFIENLGTILCDSGKKVAVLSIDPTSAVNGGSILGDKTRMQTLASHPGAFIRPSPSGSNHGGVGHRTRESVLLCEAAGYDVVFVETVGVGQIEFAAADMVDLFVLLLLPSAGDELQGIKRGILERADMLIINKADGVLQETATQTVLEYRSAFQLLRKTSNDDKHDASTVCAISSLNSLDVENTWKVLSNIWDGYCKSGRLDSIRKSQRAQWVRDELYAHLMDRLHEEIESNANFRAMHEGVTNGKLSPGSAIKSLLGS